MKTGRRILLLGTILLSGCGGGRDTAESSFRVIDAPANYVQGPPGRSETRTTTTTTTVSSDAVTPGRTVNAPPRSRQQPAVQTQPGPASTPRVTRNTSGETPRSSPSPAPRSVTAPPTSYPTAKAVPGKAGYVFSPYDPNGGYVDVSGFSPGSKVKDPYSGKIFLVP
ncbi:MAG TPA: hypothetical protein VGW39_05770 [Chthoniobacterales bacterium]|nr:hypothetical protein [Chthoniobacterales bacterium]